MLQHLKYGLVVCLMPLLVFGGDAQSQSSQNTTSTDYSNPENWAALPTKNDQADQTPKGLKDQQQNAKIDVFYVHPTMFLDRKRKLEWNATLADAKTNEKVDKSAVRFQATIFNGVAKIYAPRYRQAHIYCYYAPKSEEKLVKKALDLAYTDVEAAFDYYLNYFNNGRPFIIAAHSQGTQHAAKLIKQKIENNAQLAQKMVCAYLVGMPVESNYFNTLKPCKDSTDLNCFCTWRTFEKDFIPKNRPSNLNIIVHNPIDWTHNQDNNYTNKNKHRGAVLYGFEPIANICDAQTHTGLLWITKPKFKRSALLNLTLKGNYHLGDFNLFYMDVRHNAEIRTKKYLLLNNIE